MDSRIKEIRIGTRGSKLALWQANFMKNKLETLGHKCEITILKTQGDNIQDIGFDKMEGKGFFTKELEQALLQDQIDLAVHSMKDMQTQGPPSLSITAVSEREDPRDIIILNKKHTSIQILKENNNCVIGTSSARRKAQIKFLFPNVIVKDLRGNVPTRLEKLETENYDAIILANAGIKRLNIDLSNHSFLALDPSEMVPAPAQGVMAIQTRKNDVELRKTLQDLHHKEVAICTNIERGVLKALDGGCQLPLGVYVHEKMTGIYQAYISYKPENGSILNFQITQSTYTGMKEQILEKIAQL